MNDLLSISEACDLYRVSRKTLYNWAASGRISMIKKSGRSYIKMSEVSNHAQHRDVHMSMCNNVELHNRIDELLHRISHLECVITQLCDSLLQCDTFTQSKISSRSSQNTKTDSIESNSNARPYDTRRSEEWLTKCQRAFLELDPQLQETITKKEFSAIVGVSRGTVTKRWREIISIKDQPK